MVQKKKGNKALLKSIVGRGVSSKTDRSQQRKECTTRGGCGRYRLGC
jgi:hypothetical protein